MFDTSPNEGGQLCSMSAASSVRGSPEYLHAFELEAWKREQESIFHQQLKVKEQRFREAWEHELADKEAQRDAEFRAKMKQLLGIEQKLKQRMTDLESREIKISQAEDDIKRERRDMELKIRRLNEEHSSSLRHAEEVHGCMIRTEQERLRLEVLRRTEAEKELERRSKPRAALPSEVADLQAKLQIKEYELSQALEREKLMTESREHFRKALVQVMTKNSQQSPQIEECQTPSFHAAPNEHDERIKRLQKQKSDLIDSGYALDDPAVISLNHQIQKALALRDVAMASGDFGER